MSNCKDCQDLRESLARERERHQLAVDNLRELGLPTRERDELWSAWQYRVNLHREAIALLEPAPVATGEGHDERGVTTGA